MAVGALASIRTRRDVWKLPANDTTLEWYAKAIAALWDKPFDDPLGWRYQGAIHDYNPADDPLKKPGDQPPADDDRFRGLCQHGSAYFLPWHRMYLFYFEQLIAATVVQLGGPAGWSLPYWNYSDQNNPNARQLPPTFRDHNSRLFVAQRHPTINAGQSMAAPRVRLNCLRYGQFFGIDNGEGGGFGGQNTGDPVHSGDLSGGLENTPHGAVHIGVGGAGPPETAGWMSKFWTAALDPIFWLHHSNIDRLWEVWRNRDVSHQNPNDNAWRTQSFDFHDSTGQIVSLTVAQVLETKADPLRYQYEDITDPLQGV
jgi:tyrosinase